MSNKPNDNEVEFLFVPHQENCKSQKRYCTFDRHVIAFKNRPYVLDLPYCACEGKHYEYIFRMLKKYDKGVRMYKNQYAWKANIYDNELKEHRLKGKPLRKWCTEVNYEYFDNDGNVYSIVSKVRFFDKIKTWSDYSDERDDILNILCPSERGRVKSLFLQNQVIISDKEIRLSMDFFNKKIKTKINEASKQ